MSELKSALFECQRICDKYEEVIGGYAKGGLYVQFCDEAMNMAFLIAVCDENVTPAEVSLINNTFDKMINYEMLIRRYGNDCLSEDSFLQKVPKVIQLVAKAEKADVLRETNYLQDTWRLYNFLEQLGNVLVNCSGARLKFAIKLMDYFQNGMKEFIYEIEAQEGIAELPKIRESRMEDKETIFARSDEPFIKEINRILEEIDALVGLVNVKKEIHDTVNLLIVQKIREMKGFKTTNVTRHMVFMGNPGTGKTTIARKLGDIFKHLEILKNGHMVEVDRSALVSSEMGKTAENVRKYANEAMGGVLFIDEAYALASDIEGDYGQEAIDTLLKIMEDERENMIVIVAGYNDLMQNFLDANPGLRSRFSKFIKFLDYSEVELYEIFELYCKQQDYILADGTKQIILDKIRSMKEINMQHFGNARTIRNYFERVISNQANRMVQEYGFSDDNALITITADDL
ncbi:MAG: AAA family ATPase [Lachnospiraceae bacterium]|nr:AAA family ATPase [Lachnospiraceae bacterium]